jgi:hypothetical protein
MSPRTSRTLTMLLALFLMSALGTRTFAQHANSLVVHVPTTADDPTGPNPLPPPPGPGFALHF